MLAEIVTADVDHLTRVPGVRVEDWSVDYLLSSSKAVVLILNFPEMVPPRVVET